MGEVLSSSACTSWKRSRKGRRLATGIVLADVRKLILFRRTRLKQVNRRFTNPAATAPPRVANSFDEIVRELQLLPEEYKSSATLREWIIRNKDQKYVPSELLKHYGLDSMDDQ
jgi:hypothetical protein